MFSKITAKKFLWGITIFQGMVCRTTKMNIIFSMGNGVLNTTLKFFPRKTPYRLNENQKTSFGGTFSPTSVLKKKKKSRVHLCVDLHQPCEFHENRFKTATCIVSVIIIISWKSRSVIFNANWRTSMKFCCSKIYSFEIKFYGE